MMKEISNRRIIGFFITFGLVVVALMLVVLSFAHRSSHRFYIFETIHDCENLIAYEQTEADIIRYHQAADHDRDIGNLNYREFFGMQYQSPTLEYEIFAYEFEDKDSALRYFVSVTGKSNFEKNLPLIEEDTNKLFSRSIGMSTDRIVVTYQNKAYQITAPNQYIEKIDQMLESTFVLPLTELP